MENVAERYIGRGGGATVKAAAVNPAPRQGRAIIAGVTRTGIETGFLLDQQWHLLRGEMERSKEPALLLIGRILAEADVPYAVIGGLALQIHQPEPRTTLDIELAVLSRAAIPRARLEAAGFSRTGQFAHSENWVGPGNTPVNSPMTRRCPEPSVVPRRLRSAAFVSGSSGALTCFTRSCEQLPIPRDGARSGYRISPTPRLCSRPPPTWRAGSLLTSASGSIGSRTDGSTPAGTKIPRNN